jgi:hypothetical protein
MLEYIADRFICNIIGQHVRRIGNPNALLLTFGQINLVQPHTVTRNDLQLGQRLDELCVGTDFGVPHQCFDGIGVVLQEIRERGMGPKFEEIEAILELFFEVFRHWAGH